MLKDGGGHEITADRDPLGQWAALQTVVGAVDALDPPSCVALYGAWGAGKTALLKNAQRMLGSARDGGPQHVTVWFDPWHYERRDDLLSPLIRGLVKVIEGEQGRDPDRWKKIKAKAAWLGKTALGLAARVGVRWLTGAAIDAMSDDAEARKAHPLHALDTVKEEDLTKYYEAWATYQDEIETVKRQFASLVAFALGEADGDPEAVPADDRRRVVFFLDDLDRCLPAQVVHLIEAVKLLLCGAPNCRAQFVFALDRQIVGEAIREQYKGASQYTGENYLEKIFDLSLETPPVGATELKAYVKSLLDLLNARHFFGRGRGVEWLLEPFQGPRAADALLLEVLGTPHFANPRVVKRALNRLALLRRAEDVCDWLKGLDKGLREGRETEMRRCLAWVAGAERFRSFRRFFQSASQDELVALHKRTEALPGGDTRADADLIVSLVAAPGMHGYYKQLTGGQPLAALAAEDAVLRQFDDRLRRVAL